jgi:triosephosphate isomerase
MRHQESNDLVVKKAGVAISSGLKPVICVGETLAQRQSGQMVQVLTEQVEVILRGLDQQLDQIVLAYEPIWAIGTGQTASAQQAQEVHALMRGIIEKKDPMIAQNVCIIYGGSVKSNNASELLKMSDIDGLLVGGASLVASEFLSICTAN